MAASFRCPRCKVFLHTLAGFVDNCTMRYGHNINGNGDIVKTSESIECNNEIEFACDQCGYHTQNANEFITDIECDCEHDNSTVEVYNGFDIEVCQRCGLVISTEPDDVFVLVAQSMRQEDSPYYANMSQMVALAKEHGLDGVKFAQFWQMRFPNHGTSYMKDWARRLREGTAKEQADHETMRALHKCGLLE